MNEDVRAKVKMLEVSTPQGLAGELRRESQYVFNYDKKQGKSCEIALTMPLRAASYSEGALHPIFSMNLPEGNLEYEIKSRFAKQYSKLDEMAMLEIVGRDQIGRLTLSEPTRSVFTKRPEIGLGELLKAKASDQLFDYLLETYLESGISGVQPKVLLPDSDVETSEKNTYRVSDLIVKSSGAEYPHLTQNEFLCMDAGRRAGISVPEFHLSEDGSLFIMRRFDRMDNGGRMGFEDISVLLGRSPDKFDKYKYSGGYEMIADVIGLYCGPNSAESKGRLFEYVALSCLVRNGDAHLKNFGILYEAPDKLDSIRLSPMYDVVNTSSYEMGYQKITGAPKKDKTLALQLNKSNQYPDRKTLVEFGHRCNVLKPERVLERIEQAMTESLEQNRDRVPDKLWQSVKKEWDMSRLGLDSQVERPRLIGSLGHRYAYKQALAPVADSGWTAAQEQRAGMVENLKAMTTGALLTFAEISSEAIAKAGNAAKVDWRGVEDKTILKALKDDQQPGEDVYRAISGASPAAITDEQKAALRERVNVVVLAVAQEQQEIPSANLGTEPAQ